MKIVVKLKDQQVEIIERINNYVDVLIKDFHLS